MGKKRGKNVAHCSFVLLLELFGSKEMVGLLIIRGNQPEGLNLLSFVIFGFGRKCTAFGLQLFFVWIDWPLI